MVTFLIVNFFIPHCFVYLIVFPPQLNAKKETLVAKIMKVINFYLVCTLTVTLNIVMKVSNSVCEIHVVEQLNNEIQWIKF